MSEQKGVRLHLDFLDGIRGLAALYVAQFHIVADIDGKPAHTHLATRWLHCGHYAVGIFIVLSGYCLMLPVARSADGRLQSSVMEYLKRRARRIIPPYYVALIFTLLLIAVTQLIKHTPQQGMEGGWHVFSPVNLLLHFSLLHNLNSEFRQSIDPPMWSVALEWQIYFLFPLVLLPLWRAIGAVKTSLISLLVTALPHFLLPTDHNFDYLNLWYIGLFALGMAGAAICFAASPPDCAWRDRLSWGTITTVLAMVWLLLAAWTYPNEDGSTHLFLDVIIGLMTMCLIVYCTRSSAVSVRNFPMILRLLSKPGCVLLGKFSYSLYLMHLPVWWLIQPLMRALHLHGFQIFLFQLFVGMPAALIGSYIFHLLVERRFMSMPPSASTAPVSRQSCRA